MSQPSYQQLDMMDCGAACLQSISKYYGKYWSYGIWSDGIPNRSALQGPPLQSDKWHRFYRIKYFTNDRLRIDSFQPSSLLVVNDAIMGGFCK